MSLTALYRQPALLSREQHRGKRLRKLAHFGLAERLNAGFLAASEFGEAAKEYVIAFVPVPEKDEQGRAEVSPVALLGLRREENLFVDAAGRWDAHYLPAFVRRYPLAYGRGEDGNRSVVVDTGYDGFNDREGELLIDHAGEATPFLKDMIQFLDAFEQELQRTRALCRVLVDLDLLKAVQIDVTLPDGQLFNANGVLVIDEERLKALPDAKAVELLRNGALGLLHAQLISMTNIQRLTERLGARMEVVKAAQPA